jgi:hypothetical protein
LTRQSHEAGQSAQRGIMDVAGEHLEGGVVAERVDPRHAGGVAQGGLDLVGDELFVESSGERHSGLATRAGHLRGLPLGAT